MSMKDSEMAFIPGGIFLMGSKEGNLNEKPVHEVEVTPFYLDRYVVTNRQYQEFMIANPQWQKDKVSASSVDGDYLNIWDGNNYPEGLADYAVINISWHAAMAYAHWLGKRLPTESEWEFAAGGNEHYKWSLSNQFDSQFYSFSNTDDPVGFKVGAYPPNSFGLYDMSGGVWEWTVDSYELDYYYRSPKENPINLIETERKSLRGGSSHFDNPSYLRCAVRGSNIPQACHEDYGFRCALDARQP